MAQKETSSVGPSLSFLQKHFGPTFMTKKRKTDIELPPMNKERKKRPLSKLDEIKEGYGIFKKLAAEGGK